MSCSSALAHARVWGCSMVAAPMRSGSALVRLRLTHVLRQLYPSLVLRDERFKALSLLSMAYVLSIIATGVHLVCTAVVPHLHAQPVLNGVLLVSFAWCITNCVASYLLTACVDPGKIPESWRPLEQRCVPATTGEQAVATTLPSPPHPPAVDVAMMLTSDGNPRFCSKCRIFKPDRAHHCSSCKRCVLCMGA